MAKGLYVTRDQAQNFYMTRVDFDGRQGEVRFEDSPLKFLTRLLKIPL